MAMTKITFEDLPSTNTPIDANNLNTLQDNVETAINSGDNAKLDKTGGEISGNLNVIGTLKKGNVDVLTKSSGSWTPYFSTLEGATPTVTYSSRSGHYEKIGNLVFITFYIRGKITALTGTNNYGMILGLPFNVDSNIRADGNFAISIGEMYDVINSMNNPKLWIGAGSSASYIRIQNNSGASAGVLKVTSGEYFYFGGSGWYIAE